MDISLRQSVMLDSARQSFTHPDIYNLQSDSFRKMSTEFEKIEFVESDTFSNKHQVDQQRDNDFSSKKMLESGTEVNCYQVSHEDMQVSTGVNQATETKNLVNFGEIGCGTESLQTETQGTSCTIQVNEIGSQATKNVNDAGCNVKISTGE